MAQKEKKDNVTVTLPPSIEEIEKTEDNIEEKVTTNTSLISSLVKKDMPKKETKVRISLPINHKCYIGGEWYTFKKETEYLVPKEVKRVLKMAGLLRAI